MVGCRRNGHLRPSGLVGKTLCTENLEITIHNQIIEVAFDNLDERLICDFGEPIPVDVGLATYFSKSKADGKVYLRNAGARHC